MSYRKILLVEGMDDEHVLKHICGRRGLGPLDEITPLGSVERLLEDFPVRLKESDLGALGVILDADRSPEARWESLRDRLKQAGYPDVPTEPTPTGTIVDPPPESLLPRVGVWIMPDNQTEGILEDFLRFLIPADSPLLDHVESSVNTIPEQHRLFRETKRAKAVIHTWLAWQKEPGKPLGTAITAKFLDADVAQVDILVAWLRNLYSSDERPTK